MRQRRRVAKLVHGRAVKVSDINLFCSLLILDVRSLLPALPSAVLPHRAAEIEMRLLLYKIFYI